jgi:predicted MFS family arabinose efflux permease
MAIVAIGACGLGFYMLHNTLQTHGTQMVPEARGLGVAAFATALFFGQSLGVAAAAPVVDRFGVAPAMLATAIGLPLTGLALALRLRHAPGLGPSA